MYAFHSYGSTEKYEVSPGPVIIVYVTYCPSCSLITGETQHISVTTSYFTDLIFLFPELEGEDATCHGDRHSL